MIARLYDALHDPAKKEVLTMPTEDGGFTHRFYRAPRNVEEQVASRDAIAEWARTTCGWMGRSPDYKASFLATLGANNDFYKPFHENAKRWYHKAQEKTYFLNHAIIHPPVDRDKAYLNASGIADELKAFAESALAEYDVNGWTAPDLITPTDVNVIRRK
jgi:aromatic ring hydroxylase